MSWKKRMSVTAFLLGVFTMANFPQVSADDGAKTPVPDAGLGKAIAERLCISCHIISKESTATVPAGVPPFTEIANRPDQTAQRIRSVLISPHMPMPNMHLTRTEIEDIIEYLNELRDAKSGPPLLPDTKQPGPKPAYPDAT